ncbi:MAG: hypothetical protein DI537_38220 [Stutzerimonas stutzeri]|nr:MAG: hypothetical protein DI537_38220 [Stutzerimonas stutzeri]
MEISDFKLKNSHRVAALKLAIERINVQAVKPLYRRRARINRRIAFLALQALSDSGKPFGGIDLLVEAGVCVRERDLSLGQYAEHMVGVATINPSLGENWHVLTDQSGRSLIKLVSGQSDKLTMPQSVATFRRGLPSPSDHFVPVATLDWVLRHIRGCGFSDPITPLVAEITHDIAPAILKAFEDVPEVVKFLGSCTSYFALIEGFPAAAALFQTKQHEEAKASPAALNLLHALS